MGIYRKIIESLSESEASDAAKKAGLVSKGGKQSTKDTPTPPNP